MMPDYKNPRPLISVASHALVREKPDALKFDTKVVAPFCERSVSEETRRAYRRVVGEFFRFVNNRPPAEITTGDVLNFRDHLMTAKKSASTVTFKLSVIRSMFDYLRLSGYVG